MAMLQCQDLSLWVNMLLMTWCCRCLSDLVEASGVHWWNRLLVSCHLWWIMCFEDVSNGDLLEGSWQKHARVCNCLWVACLYVQPARSALALPGGSPLLGLSYSHAQHFGATAALRPRHTKAPQKKPRQTQETVPSKAICRWRAGR